MSDYSTDKLHTPTDEPFSAHDQAIIGDCIGDFAVSEIEEMIHLQTTARVLSVSSFFLVITFPLHENQLLSILLILSGTSLVTFLLNRRTRLRKFTATLINRKNLFALYKIAPEKWSLTPSGAFYSDKLNEATRFYLPLKDILPFLPTYLNFALNRLKNSLIEKLETFRTINSQRRREKEYMIANRLASYAKTCKHFQKDIESYEKETLSTLESLTKKI